MGDDGQRQGIADRGEGSVDGVGGEIGYPNAGLKAVAMGSQSFR